MKSLTPILLPGDAAGPLEAVPKQQLDGHTHPGGSHPDAATHEALGLALGHGHPYEASGAVVAHAGLSDPHPGYLTPAEGNAAYEAAGAVSAHAGAANPHPTYATDADLTTHAATPHGGSGATPPWHGAIIGCFDDGDPSKMLGRMLHNPLNATPTNITVSVARIAYFRPAADITVNTIRFFGAGATTGVYHVAIYRNSDSARLTADLSPNTAAQAWGSIAVTPAVALTAGTLYFIAVSVDTVGTTAGMQCCSGSTGRIGVLPTAWPGNLDIDAVSPKVALAFAQFAVTTGALPATAPARTAQAAWVGGMPAIFLDNA